MPVLSILGCVTSYAYQEAKLLSDDIQECSREYAKSNPVSSHSINQLIIHCHAMIDKEWQLYERNQTYRSIRPFNPSNDQSTNQSDFYEPIILHSQLGYIGGRKELLTFAQKTYNFSLDQSIDQSVNQFDELCIAIRRLIDHDLAEYISEQRHKHGKLFAALEFEFDENIGVQSSQSQRFRSIYQSTNQSNQSTKLSNRRKRLIFELDAQSCPKTCQNFLALCEGLHMSADGTLSTLSGQSINQSTNQSLHYKGTPIHRVVPNSYLQCGDVLGGRGDGVASMYGVNHTFPDECLLDANAVKSINQSTKQPISRPHDFIGCLSMVNAGRPHSNASQFMVTLGRMPSFDGKFVPFGQLIDGFDLLHIFNQSIEVSPADQSINAGRVQLRRQRPAFPVTIVESGEFHEDALSDKLSSWGASTSSRPSSSPSTNQSTDQPLPKVTLLVIGPESAGKSTLVSMWCGAPRLGSPEADFQPLMRPTVGFELDRLKGVHDLDVSIFGLGGAKNIKGYWSSYYDAAYAVAYVVDSSVSGEEYWETTRRDLQDVKRHEMVAGKPVYVVTNPRAAGNGGQCVASRLMHHPQFVVDVDLVSGQGVSESLDAILTSVSEQFTSLEERVKLDVEQRKREAREVMERRRQEREAEAQQASAKLEEESKVAEQATTV